MYMIILVLIEIINTKITWLYIIYIIKEIGASKFSKIKQN